MEGLQFPEGNEANLFFFLVDSALYKTNNSKRLHLTKQVIDKHDIHNQVLSLESSSKLGQAFEFMVLSSYTNFYLAMLNNVNPSPIPWVDWFKAELKK